MPEPYDFEKFKILPKLFPGLRRQEIEEETEMTESEQEALKNRVVGWASATKKRLAE